jgi:hypothetical protein
LRAEEKPRWRATGREFASPGGGPLASLFFTVLMFGSGHTDAFAFDAKFINSINPRILTRSLLKIPFTQRGDYSKKRTLRLGFVVGLPISPQCPPNRKLEWLLLHALCARSFGIRIRLKTAQLNTNNQSTFASPRSFTFFIGPICFNHPNGFSTNQRLLKLIA